MIITALSRLFTNYSRAGRFFDYPAQSGVLVDKQGKGTYNFIKNNTNKQEAFP